MWFLVRFSGVVCHAISFRSRKPCNHTIVHLRNLLSPGFPRRRDSPYRYLLPHRRFCRTPLHKLPEQGFAGSPLPAKRLSRAFTCIQPRRVERHDAGRQLSLLVMGCHGHQRQHLPPHVFSQRIGRAAPAGAYRRRSLRRRLTERQTPRRPRAGKKMADWHSGPSKSSNISSTISSITL